ncbi:MAG: WYL domain-containing protein [Elusimicrobiales bacterium]
MPPKDFAGDKKYYRVLKILNLLNEKGKVKVPDLADEFAVSERSIQRDIERVNMTFGLEQTDKAEYSFAPGVSLKEMRLSGEQLSALIFMHEMFKGMGGAFSKSFEALFHRMTKSSPWESPYAIIMPRPGKNLDIRKFIPDIETAILEHRALSVEYIRKGETVRRTLAPLKILVDNGFYYILCMAVKKGEYVKYRLDNIKSLELAPQTFVPPADIDKAIHDATSVWGAMPARDRKILMRLKIAPSAADFFRKKEFFPLQTIKKEERDGSLILESRLAQLMEAIPTILNWIPDIEVLEPETLKAEIRARVERYLRKIDPPARR